MEAKLEISRDSATASKTIQLRTNPEGITSGEGFEVRITDEEIRIGGHGEAGVLRGIYWLQDQMETREGPFLAKGTFSRKPVWSPRHLYSYFALYGDPLMETDIDPFPDAYLEKLARVGINGVWLQAVLNNLAPSADFPEFGKGWETRLDNLNALVERARRFGIKVYLYLNEPRAMPPEFFRNRAGLRGEPHRGLYSLCTSTPVVRKRIAASLAHVSERVPD
ncbi:MAG: hypothetical protein GY953_45240, partial [bacterium]|nr:hypothetical protein [bacterium]